MVRCMTFRAFTIMKIVVVVSFAICALVFLLLPDDSQAGKTKKGPLVTEKVGKLFFNRGYPIDERLGR